jgi:hypothetical protein
VSHKLQMRQGFRLVAVLSLMVVVGCSSSSGPARTVSYFQAHPKEREALYKRCADDPGTLGKSAECVNVSQAEAIEGIGSFRDLPPMHFPPVPGAKGNVRARVPDRKSAPSR